MMSTESYIHFGPDIAFVGTSKSLLHPVAIDGTQRVSVTDRFVDKARAVAANDEIYDLEESHSSDEPRVRRIKTPHLHDPEYAHAAQHPKIVEVLGSVGNGSLRYR
jgi:hypothetical protein